MIDIIGCGLGTFWRQRRREKRAHVPRSIDVHVVRHLMRLLIVSCKAQRAIGNFKSRLVGASQSALSVSLRLEHRTALDISWDETFWVTRQLPPRFCSDCVLSGDCGRPLIRVAVTLLVVVSSGKLRKRFPSASSTLGIIKYSNVAVLGTALLRRRTFVRIILRRIKDFSRPSSRDLSARRGNAILSSTVLANANRFTDLLVKTRPIPVRGPYS